MDIRNQLTLELVSTLHPTETFPHSTGPLAYSPDGHAIACASDTAVIIWDVQTGGVTRLIERSAKKISLVWSSDGRTICTIDSEDQTGFAVHMYDTSSGTTLSPGTLQSGDNPYLWTDDESFWVMTTVYHDRTICIFKVGPALTRIRSFNLPLAHGAKIGSFSPTARRISISDDRTLRILDIQSSECLLDEHLHYSSHFFSSDGSYFAASWEDGLYVWKYYHGNYIRWGEFQCQGLTNSPLQFSPTPSSILGCPGGLLRVWRLHELTGFFNTRRWRYVGLSHSWARVATAHELENTITITDLLGQNPPQFIDTYMGVEGLVITGNVLLVAGSGQLVAWLLTEDGLVDGVIGDRRGYGGDCIWTLKGLTRWEFKVQGQVGAIKLPGNALYVYHTQTGETLPPTQAPWYFHKPWDVVLIDWIHFGRDYLHFHNLHQGEIPPGDRWKTSRATLREGWVKDAEGRHRLWVPTEWRGDWDPEDWRHDVTTQFGYLASRFVLVKF